MKFWVVFSILVFSLVGHAGSPRISDELVSNLSCQHLSADSIYRSIKPGAMSIPRRSTISNFDSYLISNCWSLSRFQRLSLLLGRRNDPTAEKFTPKQIGDLARGWGYRARPNARGIEERPLDFRVFNWPFARNDGDYEMPIILQSISAALAPSSLEDEIANKQFRNFYRGSNLSYVLFSPSFAQQTATLKEFFRRVQGNRLPMINVRMARTDHHVVLGLKVKQVDPNKWEVDVIDPNYPTGETTLHISRANGAFNMRLDMPWARSNKSYDIDAAWLFDDGEEQKIDVALLRHYGEKCSAASRGK